MDMQAKIAARRAELESHTRESDRLAAEQAQAQRKQALNEIAAEISKEGLAVHRQGDKLVASKVEGVPFGVDGLKQSAIDKLLREEARKMWTPSENVQVIAMIVAGVFLIAIYGLGLVLVAVGLLARNGLNKRYKAQLRRRYPAVFLSSESEATVAMIEARSPGL